MKVLVLGGTGYVGARLCSLLRESDWAQPIAASSRAQVGPGQLRLDSRDARALAEALRGVDAVVNCVAGDAASIAEGARALAQAAAEAGRPRVVHLSTMSVYGALEGVVSEQTEPGPLLGWYDRSKREAEQHVAAFAAGGGSAVMLRPGCVWGPGSELWVGRVGRWLQARRLGDLGVQGDGWSNLVHLDDVCMAIIRALQLPLADKELRTYNLAAPDSPRWNEYFVDLALAIGATPVARVRARQLTLDAKLAGPALQVLRIAARKLGRDPSRLPEPVTPGLVGLWQRHLHLDSRAAGRELRLAWTPYSTTLQESATWFLQQQAVRRPGLGVGAVPAGH